VDEPTRNYEVRSAHEGAWELDFLFIVTPCFKCAVAKINELANQELKVHFEVFGVNPDDEELTTAHFTPNFYITPQESGE